MINSQEPLKEWFYLTFRVNDNIIGEETFKRKNLKLFLDKITIYYYKKHCKGDQILNVRIISMNDYWFKENGKDLKQETNFFYSEAHYRFCFKCKRLVLKYLGEMKDEKFICSKCLR